MPDINTFILKIPQRERMETQTRYTYLEQRPDKRTAGTLYSGDWGADVDDLVRSLYLSRMTPQQIAQNRDLPMAAILSLGILPRPLGGDLCRKGRGAGVA